MSTVPIASNSEAPTHTIEIILQNDTATFKDSLPAMNVGETVLYFSRDGEVTIAFPGRSPFRSDAQTNTEVHGQVILTLLSDSGEESSGFISHCSLKLKNGQIVGWPNEAARSGGETHVGKPFKATGP